VSFGGWEASAWARRNDRLEEGMVTGMDFFLHDLRRTFITVASPRYAGTTVKMLVNHSSRRDVTAGYDQPSPEGDRLTWLRRR
jgi:hypothetical protein